MKNTTRIGASLLGTWTAQVNLSSDHDSLTAYLMVHFMADPRKGHGCDLPVSECSEADNKVCMLSAVTDHGHADIKKSCHDIAEEKDVSWSDLTVFYYFGVKIHSESEPKAQLELSTGDWVGPWNLIMAQQDNSNDDISNGTSSKNETYVVRYVQSQSMTPPWIQNMAPALCTLYTKPDLYAAFLGNPALEYMTRVQTNFSVTPTVDKDENENDPYAPYQDTCDHGNLQPILPLLELDFFHNDTTTNSTNADAIDSDSDNDNDEGLQMKLKFQYKIMAVPTPDEQAYRVLPQLQSKFQGVGGYNIIGGPYCYGDDPRRGYSFDLNFSSTASVNDIPAISGGDKKMTLVRGCMDGLPCYPPAAMGGIPFQPSNQSCDNHDHPYHPPTPEHSTGIPNLALAIVCYGLVVALVLSIVYHSNVLSHHKMLWKRRRGLTGNNDDEDFMTAMRMSNTGGGEEPAARGDDKPVYFGAMNLMKGVGIGGGEHQDETVGPFGDLDRETETSAVDPLQEPLLAQDAKDEGKEEEKEEGKDEEQDEAPVN